MLGKLWKNRGITIADYTVTRAIRDHPIKRFGVATIASFLEIAKRLIDLSTTIFVHGLLIANATKHMLNHVIERLRSVPTGTDAENS